MNQHSGFGGEHVCKYSIQHLILSMKDGRLVLKVLLSEGGDYILRATVVDGSSVCVPNSRNTATHHSVVSELGCHPHVLLYWTTVSAVPSHLPLLARRLQQEHGALTPGLPRLLTAAVEPPTLATEAEAADAEPTPTMPEWGVSYQVLFLKNLFKTWTYQPDQKGKNK